MRRGGWTARVGRWVLRALLMPHHVAEAVQRLRTLDAALAASRPPPAPLPDTPAPPLSPKQVYRGYSDADLALFDLFAGQPPPAPAPGFITNFLGVRTRVAFVRGNEPKSGAVLGVPVPDDDWHSDAIEWVGVLKAVAAAHGRFTMMELGAGWGPWVVDGAAAARRRGVAGLHLCAVEADPGHFAFMRQHFRDNGLDPAAHRLIRAAVGVEAGTARWPRVDDPAADWGSRPLAEAQAGAPDHIGRHFAEWVDVEVVPFAALLREQAAWDLVHIDVQGWEVDLCAAAAGLLDERVRWLVVATHDAKLHGDLVDLMFRRGWSLENEKPPRFGWRDGMPSLMSMTTLDGAQVWRNPRRIGDDGA